MHLAVLDSSLKFECERGERASFNRFRGRNRKISFEFMGHRPLTNTVHCFVVPFLHQEPVGNGEKEFVRGFSCTKLVSGARSFLRACHGVVFSNQHQGLIVAHGMRISNPFALPPFVFYGISSDWVGSFRAVGILFKINRVKCCVSQPIKYSCNTNKFLLIRKVAW